MNELLSSSLKWRSMAAIAFYSSGMNRKPAYYHDNILTKNIFEYLYNKILIEIHINIYVHIEKKKQVVLTHGG